MAPSKARGKRASVLVAMGLTLVTGAVWAGYVGYDYTESTGFCTTRCHTAMAPQAFAHEQSPHRGVACVQCHVARGVGAHLCAKFTSSSRVVTAAFDSYRGPIRSPSEHSSQIDARCKSCHRMENAVPTKSVRVRYFRFDQSNTPEHITLTLNLATRHADDSSLGGAHWHVNAGARVTYAAGDPLRQRVPWIHVRRADGSEITYSASKPPLDAEPAGQLVEYQMGCVDCHNRAGHHSPSPETRVDQALLAGALPASLPWIKAFAVDALTSKSPATHATNQVAKTLVDNYQAHAPGVLLQQSEAVRAAGKVLVEIHDRLVFPALRADHASYPNNLGHLHWRGCLRCHDGQHVAPDGRLLASDCGQTCHSEPQRSPDGNPLGNEPHSSVDWHPWPNPAKVLDVPGHRQLLCPDCHHAGANPKRTCDDCHTPG